uniref:Uncharacterized protein n=1 Tax=Tanacetum cinerariifolium TaxID=118510 RepID=A0A699GHH1_TANCI|nr:hypothetical protein [Tanacetum cinerariifolium]
MVAVVDDGRADVERAARGDGGRHAAFGAVVQGTGADGQCVAIDAAGTDVVERTGVHLSRDAIDHAPVVEGAGHIDPRRAGIDIAGDVVVETGRPQYQRTARLHLAVVDEIAADGDRGVAVGNHLGARFHDVAAAQIEAQVALRHHAAHAGQAGRLDRRRRAADDGAAGIGNHQLAAGAVIADYHRVVGADQARSIVQLAAAADGQVVVGPQAAVPVVDHAGCQADVASLDAQAGSLGARVDDAGRGQRDRGAAADQAGAVVDGSTARLQVEIAHRLDLPALVGQAADGQRQAAAGHDAAAQVVDIAGAAVDRACRAQGAPGIVPVAHGQRQRAAAADAAAGATVAGGIGCRIAVVDRVAVGIDPQHAARLQQAGLVDQCPRLQVQHLRGSDGAQIVVKGQATGIDGDVAADNAAAGPNAAGHRIVQRPRLQDHVAARLHLAAGVAHLPGDHAQVAIDAGQLAAGVVHAGGAHVEVAVGGQQAARVIERLVGRHAQAAARRHRTAMVEDIARVDRGVAAHCHAAAVAVVQHGAGRQVERARARHLHHAALVVDVPGANGGVAVAGNQAGPVVQALRHADDGRARPQLHQLALPVVEAARVDAQAAGLGAGIAVVDAARCDVQRAVGRDLSALVVERSRLDGQLAGAGMGDRASRVVEGGRAQRQVAAVDGNPAFGIVEHTIGVAHHQRGVTAAVLDDAAFAVVEAADLHLPLSGNHLAQAVIPRLSRVGGHRQRAAGVQRGAGAADVTGRGRQRQLSGTGQAARQVHAGTCQVGGASRQVLAGRMQALPCGHAQVAAGGKLAVLLHAGRDQAAGRAVDHAGCQRGIAQRGNHAAIAERARHVQRLRAAVQGAAVAHIGCMRRQQRAGKDAAAVIVEVAYLQRGVARIRLQAAARVVEIGGIDRQTGGAGHGAAGIVDRGVAARLQHAAGRHATRLVQQQARLHCHAAVAFDAAAAVVQRAAGHDRRLAGAQLQQFAAAVVQRARIHIQLLGHRAGVAMVENRGAHVQRAVAGNLAALAVDVGCRDRQGARARVFDLAIGVDDGRRRQLQVAGIDGNAARRIVQHAIAGQCDGSVAHARLDDGAANVIQVTQPKIDLARAELAALVRQRLISLTVGGDGQYAGGAHHCCRRADIAAGGRQADSGCAGAAARQIDAPLALSPAASKPPPATSCAVTVAGIDQVRLHGSGQIAAGVQFSCSVVQAASGDLHRAVGGNHALAVVEAVRHVHHRTGGGLQRAALVRQRLCQHVQLARRRGGAAVVERPCRDVDQAIADDGAGTAVQLRRRDGQAAAARVFDLAGLVDQLAGIEPGIGAVEGNPAPGVVQHAHGNNGIAAARLHHGARSIVQIGCGQGQLSRLQHARAVVQVALAADGQAARRSRSGRDGNAGGAGLAGSEVHAAAGQRHRARRQVLAVGRQRLDGRHRQVARSAQAAIGVDAGADQAGRAAVQAVRGQRYIAVRGQHARAGHCAAGRQDLVAACVQAAAVADVACRGRQAVGSKDAACRVDQVADGERGIAGRCLQLAARVVHVATGQHQFAACGNHAAGVVELVESQCGLTGSLDAALDVTQCTGRDQRRAIACDGAARIVQHAGGRDRHLARACLRQAAVAVVDRSCSHRQLPARGGRIAMVEVVRPQFHQVVAGDLAALVVDLAGRNRERAGARVLDLAIDVGQRGHAQRQIGAIDGNAAARVVEHARVDAGVAGAGLDDDAQRIIQVADLQLQLARFQLAAEIGQLLAGAVGGDCQQFPGRHQRLAGCHVAAARRDGNAVRPHLAGRQVDRRSGQRCAARRQGLAAGLQQSVGGDMQVAGRAQAAVGADAGAQQALAGQRARRHAVIVRRDDGTGVGQQAAHGQLRLATRIQHAVGIVERAGAGNIEGGSRRDAPARVVQAGRLHRQHAAARMLDLAAAVDQRIGGQVQLAAVDGNPAAGVVEVAGGNGRLARTGLQDHAAGVIEAGRSDVELAGLQGAAPIVQSATGADIEYPRRVDHGAGRADAACVTGETDVGGARLAAGEIDHTGRQHRVARRQVLAVRGQRVGSRQGQVARIAQAAIGLDAGADQAARATVEASGRYRQVVLRGQHARVDDGAGNVHHLPVARIQAAAIDHAGGGRVQIAAGKHAAASIVQVAHGERGVAARLQLAARVVEVAARHHQAGAGADGAVRVIEAAGGNGHCAPGRGGVAVIDAGGRDAYLVVAGNLAALVVQLLGRDRQGAAACVLELAIDVGQRRRAQRQVGAVDGDPARRVVQQRRDNDGVAGAGLDDSAARVVEVSHLQLQLPRLQPAAGIDQLLAAGVVGVNIERVAGGHLRPAGDHVAVARRDGNRVRAHLAACHIHRRPRQPGGACRQRLAACLQQAVRADRQVARRAHAAIGLDARAHQTVAGHAGRDDVRIAGRRDRAGIDQRAAHRQARVGAGVQQAASIVEAGGRGHLQRCGRRHAALAVVEVARMHRQLSGLHAAFAVVQRAGCVQVEAAGHVDRRLAQVDSAVRRVQRQGGGVRCAAGQVDGQSAERRVARRQVLAMRRQYAAGGDRQVTCRAQLAVGQDAGADQAVAAALQAAHGQRRIALGGNHARIDHGAADRQLLVAGRRGCRHAQVVARGHAAAVGERDCGNTQVAARGHAAAGGQRGCGDAQVAARGHAAAAGQRGCGDAQVAARIHAAAIGQRGCGDAQVAARVHAAGNVVELADIERGVAGCGLQAAARIVDVRAVQIQLVAAGDGAVHVGQVAHAHVGVMPGHDASAVVAQLIGGDQRIAIALDRAARVVDQAGGIHRHAAGSGLDDAAAVVVEVGHRQLQLLRLQLAAGVDQPLAVAGTGGNGQQTTGAERGAVGHHIAAARRDVEPIGADLAARQVDLRASQPRTAGGQHLAAGLQHPGRREPQVAGPSQRAIRVQARPQQTAAADAGGGHRDVVAGRDRAGILDAPAHGPVLVARGVQQAAVGDIAADPRHQVGAGAGRALRIDQAGCVHGQRGARLQHAARIVQRAAGDVQRLRGSQHAVAVVEAAFDGHLGGGSRHAALLVRQRCRVQRQRAVGGHGAVGIVQQSVHVHLHLASARLLQPAAAMVEGRGVQQHLLTGRGSAAQVQRVRLQVQHAVARHAPLLAVEPPGRDRQRAGACVFHAAALVDEGICGHGRIAAVDRQTPAGIVQRAGAQHRVAAAGLDDGAAAVVECARGQHQLARVQCAAHIGQRLRGGGRRHGERAGRGHLGPVGDHIARLRIEHDVGAGRLAGGHVDAGRAQHRVAPGQVLAMGNDGARGRDVQRAPIGQRAVRPHARAQQAAGRAGDAAGVDAGIARGRHHAGIIEPAAGQQRQAAGRVEAAAIQNVVRRDAHVAAGRHAAAGVIQRGRRQAHVARHRLDLPARVVDGAGSHLQRAARRQHAIAVDQRAGVERQRLAGRQPSLFVAHRGRADGGSAVGVDGAAPVVQQGAGLHRGPALASLRQAAATVVEHARLHGQLAGHGTRAAVIDVRTRERQGAVGTDGAALQVQRPGRQVEPSRARMLDGAVHVGQAGGVQGQGVAVGGDHAAGVVQRAGQVDGQVGSAQLHDAPVHIGQRLRVDGKRLRRQLAARVVHRLRRIEPQANARIHLGARQLQVAGRGGQRQAGARNLRASQVEATSRHAAVAAGRHGAMHGHRIARRQVQVAARAQGIVGVQTRRDDRAGGRIDARAGRDVQVALRADQTGIGDAVLYAHAAIAARVHGAAIAQPAVRLQHQVAGGCRQHAGVAHAQPRLGADQRDLAGVHATKLRHVQRVSGRRSCAGLRGSNGVGRIEPVAAGDHVQFPGPQAAADLHGARQDGRVVGQRRVEPAAGNGHHAALHRVTVEAAAIEDGRARGQHHAAGVDETAAVDGHAGRIGDHHLGALAGHFHVAAQLARVGGIDLVEDHARAAAGQPRIALHPAAGLGLHRAAAVVEDGATGLHVELAVRVARDACRAGRLDIDLRDAVAALDDGRTLAARRARIGHYLAHGRTADKQHHAQQAEHGQRHRPHHGGHHAAALSIGRTRRAARAGGLLALRGGGFAHHHQLATALVEDDAIQVLVHGGSWVRRKGKETSKKEAAGASVAGVQAEAGGLAGGAKMFGLACGPADKGVVLHAQPLAAQAHGCARQAPSHQPGGGRAAHFAMVVGGIHFLAAGAQRQAHLVAQQPAAFGGQAALAVVAAHRVPAADGKPVLRHQRRAVALQAPGAGIAQRLAGQLERRRQRGVGQYQRRARRAFAKRLLRRRQGVAGARASPVLQVGVQRGVAEEFAVARAQLPAGHAAALDFHLGVVDIVLRSALPAAHGQRRLARGVAVHQPGQLHFTVLAGAAVVVVLVDAGHRLVIVAIAGGRGQQPVTVRDGIMRDRALAPSPAPLALPDGIAVACVAVAVEVAVDAHVQQVVERQRMVEGQGQVALQAAGGARTAVVHAGGKPQRPALFPLQLQVALARAGVGAGGRNDLDIGFRRRHALEVFQRLFGVAHVEQVAAPGRHGVPPGGASGRARRKTDLAQASRQNGQRQRAAAEVLRLDQHPRGSVRWESRARPSHHAPPLPGPTEKDRHPRRAAASGQWENTATRRTVSGWLQRFRGPVANGHPDCAPAAGAADARAPAGVSVPGCCHRAWPWLPSPWQATADPRSLRRVVTMNFASNPDSKSAMRFIELAPMPAERDWLNNFASAQTRRAYHGDLADFMHDAGVSHPEQLRQVVRAHVLAWRGALLARGLAPNTIRRKLAALSSLFGALCDANVTLVNPVQGVKRPCVLSHQTRTPALSDDQARMLLNAPDPATLRGLRDRAIPATLLFQGLRRAELCALAVGDRQLRRGVLHLRVHGKGGKLRYLPLHPEATHAIDQYLAQASHGGEVRGALFRPVSSNARAGGAGITADGVYKVVVGYTATLGWQRNSCGPHALRTTAATSALDHSADIVHVQDWLGHADIATTRLRRGNTVASKKDLAAAVHQQKTMPLEWQYPSASLWECRCLAVQIKHDRTDMFRGGVKVHIASVNVVVRHRVDAGQFSVFNCRHRAVALIAAGVSPRDIVARVVRSGYRRYRTCPVNSTTMRRSDAKACKRRLFYFGKPLATFSKTAKSPAALLQKLVDQNLIVTDQGLAERYITFVGHYRLKGYWFHLIDPVTKQFKPGTTFENIQQRYEFDREIRAIILEAIERLEVAIRSSLCNFLSLKHSPHWYLDAGIFKPSGKFGLGQMLSKIESEVDRSSSKLFIRAYYKEYDDPYLPPSWAMSECVSLGMWSRTYKMLRDPLDKKAISSKFGIAQVEVFESWLHTLTVLRNMAAHHDRFLGQKLGVGPTNLKNKNIKFQDNKSVYAALTVVHFLLNAIGFNTAFNQRFIELEKRYGFDGQGPSNDSSGTGSTTSSTESLLNSYYSAKYGASSEEKRIPGTHVLIVGVGSYPHFPGHTVENPVGQVEMTARSAFALARWFTNSHTNEATPLRSVRLLLSGDETRTKAERYFRCGIQTATFANFEAEFWEWQNALKADDGSVAVFYFAGHGIGNAIAQSLFLEDYNQNINRPLAGAVNYTNLRQSVTQNESIDSAWFFIDACRLADLEQIARGAWGMELDQNVTMLAGPVRSFQLYAAGDGQESLGVLDKTTFFGDALIDALEKNGYYNTGTEWAILPSTLHLAVDVNLKLACEKAQIPQSRIPNVEVRTPAGDLELHHRSELNPPEFLVKMTCKPADHNAQYAFSYGIKGDANRTSRDAEDAPWYCHLAPGNYSFVAQSVVGGELREKEQYVQQHLVNVILKGTFYRIASDRRVRESALVRFVALAADYRSARPIEIELSNGLWGLDFDSYNGSQTAVTLRVPSTDNTHYIDAAVLDCAVPALRSKPLAPGIIEDFNDKRPRKLVASRASASSIAFDGLGKTRTQLANKLKVSARVIEFCGLPSSPSKLHRKRFPIMGSFEHRLDYWLQNWDFVQSEADVSVDVETIPGKELHTGKFQILFGDGNHRKTVITVIFSDERYILFVPHMGIRGSKKLRWMDVEIDFFDLPRTSTRGRISQVRVLTDNSAFNGIVQLLSSGRLDSASTLWKHSAQQVLRDKFADPIAAAAGALALVQPEISSSLELERLEQIWYWLKNLESRFKWIPEGSICLAWMLSAASNADLLRIENSEKLKASIAQLMIESIHKGAPVYSEGLNLLSQAVDWAASEIDEDMRFAVNCFLVECPIAGGLYRILIDGGIAGTAAVISEYLKKSGACPQIDLVVVTHIDNDHIGGIISLLKDKEINAAIKEVWFNGVSRLGAPLPANIRSLSVRQGIDLEKTLSHDPRWNTRFGMAPISLSADNSPLHVPLAEGVDIHVLSPGEVQLDELKRNWEKEAAELEKKRQKKEKLPPGIGGLGAGKNVGRLAQTKFKQDDAFANGSSIAFLLIADGKTMLFTGDAFPTVMVEAANKYKPGPIDIDVFKVSHHGSSGNTNDVIVKKFPAARYLISTDGAHDHPDEETIARILEHSKPKAKKILICNYPDTLADWKGVDFAGAWWTEVAPEVFMGRPARWMEKMTGRGAMRSPGAPSHRRETMRLFWEQIATGITSEKAAEAVGVSQAVGTRWSRHNGGMPLSILEPGFREIARLIGCSASTVSRELTRNAASRGGRLEYRASVAQWKAELVAKRPNLRNWRSMSACTTTFKTVLKVGFETPMAVQFLGRSKRRSLGETRRIAVTVNGSVVGRPNKFLTG